MENVSLAGVKGTVSIEQKKASSKKYRYFFTRDSAGKRVQAEAGTRIVNSGSYLYVDWIPIIFMGQNGGWNDDPDELIRQQRMLVDTLKLNKGRFLILGLTTGSSESRAALDAAMDAQWGWQYLNLRSYLSDPGTLEKYGLAITESDAALIAQGIVPACLRTGEVHLNATGYRAVGDLAYQALVSMGYLEK